MGRVGFAPKFGSVEQVNQVVFEIAGAFPLLLVPLGEGGNSEDAGDVGGKGAVRVGNLCQAAHVQAFRAYP